MNLRTLGGLALEGAGFNRPKPLLLLAYLALEGPTERRYLAELFWLGAANPRRSLATALSQLRRGAPGVVGSDEIRVWSEIECDASRVLRAAEQLDWSRADELYRGSFLEGLDCAGEGVELQEWVYGTRDALVHVARSALLEMGQSMAVRGRFDEARRLAERAYALDTASPPVLNDLVRIHTLLLAGGSPRADSVREDATELGLELVASADAARRSLLASTPSSVSESLPARTTPFIGRLEELVELEQLLESSESRLLSVVGAGGTGKTQLSLELVRRQADAGVWDGVHWVPLSEVGEAESVAAAIRNALGIRVQDQVGAVQQLEEEIGRSKRLILLDNFEQLTPAAPLLSELLRSCPNLRLLVTSRERLNLDEESVVLLRGMTIPGTTVTSAKEALGYEAVSLFVQRARRARPDFSLTAAHLGAVLKICRLVEGLPLALEMAAAWVRAMDCEEIADEIERGLDLLETSSPDRPERHRSMRFAFEHSWRLLTDQQQEALRALAVFRSGFGREAAGAVAGVTLPQLASLVDRSLLSWRGRRRYHLHPLWQQFLEEKARSSPDDHAAAQARQARYYLGVLQDQQEAFPRSNAGTAAAEIEADLANIVIAWEWACRHGYDELLVNSIEPLGWFFLIRGRFQQGLAWSEIPTRSGTGSLLELRQLHWRGVFLRQLGRQQEALDSAHRAVLLAETMESPIDLARTLRVAGMAHLQNTPPDEPEAESAFRRALGLYEELGDVEGAAMMLNNLAHRLEEPKEALELLEQSLRLAQGAQEEHATAMILHSLAELHLFCTGDYAAARTAVEGSLSRHEETGFTMQLGYGLMILAEVQVAAGELLEAEVVTGRMLRLCDVLEGKSEAAIRGAAYSLLGHLRRLDGEPQQAVRHYEDALSTLEPGRPNGGAVWATCTSLRGLARIDLDSGRPREARLRAQQAVELVPHDQKWNSYCHRDAKLQSLVQLGESFGLTGDQLQAGVNLRAALQLASASGRVPAVLTALAAIGDLWRKQGRETDAEEITRLVATHPSAIFELRKRTSGLRNGSHSALPMPGGIEAALDDLILRAGAA